MYDCTFLCSICVQQRCGGRWLFACACPHTPNRHQAVTRQHDGHFNSVHALTPSLTPSLRLPLSGFCIGDMWSLVVVADELKRGALCDYCQHKSLKKLLTPRLASTKTQGQTHTKRHRCRLTLTHTQRHRNKACLPSLPYHPPHSSIRPLFILSHPFIIDVAPPRPLFTSPVSSPPWLLSCRFYFCPPLTPLTSLTLTNTHYALCVLAPNANWHHTMPTTITSMG